jgi:signal transduction histidine kinase
MSLLREFVQVITIPPGDLIYHLVTLFAIQIILVVAFGHWNRNRQDPTARRLLVVGIGFFLARALLMLVAALDRVGMVWADGVMPPLERFLDFTAVLLVAWAFLPILDQNARLGVALLLILFLIAAGVYAAFAVLWRQTVGQDVFYNGYWQESVWEFSTLALLIVAFIAGVIWRTADWGLLTCLFGLWIGGHAAQYAFPITDSHTAGWVRLANLVALPLLASLVYRYALSAPLGWAPGEDEDTTLGVVGILQASRRIEGGQEVDAALELAASSVARAMGADVAAIGLMLPGPAKGLRIFALHPSTSVMLEQQNLNLMVSDHPLLATTVQTGRPQHAYTPRKISISAALYRSLGFEQSGPLLIQPLADGETLLGAMLIGNLTSQQQWTARDERIVQAMGAAITTSLINARRRAQPREHPPEDYSAELQETRDEAHRLAQRTGELEAELGQQRQRAEELATRLRLREQTATEADQEAADAALWQEEMSKLTQARAALQAELAEWKSKAERLARLKDTRPGDITAQKEMVVSLIHELRTPMDSITDCTDQMLRDEKSDLDERERQFLLRIEANVERMERLLNDLAVKVADDAGLASPSSLLIEPVAVVGVIENAIKSLAVQLDERQLSVQIDAPPDLPPVQADRDALYQVTRNLLSNAVQCSEPSTEVLVRVRSEAGESKIEDTPAHLLVSVTDTGGGIAPEERWRIFQRLQRDDASPIAGLGETGDGLSVAKALAEAMRGRLWVESEVGAGSTFSFILPLSSEGERSSLAVRPDEAEHTIEGEQ